MLSMFDDATTFNGDISGWDVSSTDNLAYMFYQASVFNQPIGLWDVSSVENMDVRWSGGDCAVFPSGSHVSTISRTHEETMAAKNFHRYRQTSSFEQ